jgi:predicted SAM-dependent methyltransferase
MKRVLEVGCGRSDFVPTYFVDYEWVRLDIDPAVEPDIVHNIHDPLPEEHQNAYDDVFCSHMLEHIDRNKIGTVMRNMVSALKVGGKLWITVPAMEWAAEQIIQGNETMAVQLTIFGGQQNEWDYHRVGFTMNALHVLYKGLGLTVVGSLREPFKVATGGTFFTCYQNAICGVKNA